MRTSLLVLLALASAAGLPSSTWAAGRPNVLLAISDDQSHPHTSAYGTVGIETPAFDRVAREGTLFRRAYCGSPGCSPSRAALLTGRYPWQIEQAGTHASSFPARYEVYPDLLESAGYFVGYTGKGWGPGNWKVSGRNRNPAGDAFNRRQLKARPAQGISRRDYAGNFRDFLAARPSDKPFCFWFGGHEPHRGFEQGSGLKHGKNPGSVTPPKFLPDDNVVRSDILDYFLEIEHFDNHLGQMIKMLEEAGELDNTLIVVTSDNGMAFPRAKANCYEYGIHVPMAIRWPKQMDGRPVRTAGNTSDELVSFVDLAPTFLDAAGLVKPETMIGQSLLKPPSATASSASNRDAVFSGRERHSSSRYQNWTYPQRAMRTGDYLLIRNFRPDRWPAGDPRKFDSKGKLGPPHGGYHDIDACPTLTWLIEHHADQAVAPFFRWAVDKRPAWELFDVKADPACLKNLALDERHADRLAQLQAKLEAFLRKTGDPRIEDGGEVFESYRRYSPIRKFPVPPTSLSEGKSG